MMSFARKFSNFFLILILFTAFVACDKNIAIVHDLNERDANEIFVLLSKSGISAKKTKHEKNQQVTWMIEVGAENELVAQNILVANRLPRVKQSSLEEICGAKVGTMILTPKQEKCRSELAIKGGIINLLTNIQGVVSADVMLNIPEKEQFGSDNQSPPRPTAAVTVQWLNNGMAQSKITKDEIQNIVASTVKDMDARDVTVHITELEYEPTVMSQINRSKATAESDEMQRNQEHATSKSDAPTDSDSGESEEEWVERDQVTVAGLNMDEASAAKFKVVASVFLLLFLLLSGAFIFVLLRLSRSRKQAVVEAEPMTDQAETDQKLLEAGLP